MNTIKSELIEALVARAVEKALSSPPPLPEPPNKLKQNAAKRHEQYRKRFGSLRPEAYLSDE